MTLQIPRKLFTVEEYHRMAEAGILTEDDRVELINGTIFKMSPIGSRHMACVKRLNAILNQLISADYIISIQDPIMVNDHSEPEPDVAVLKMREDFYEAQKPTSQDTLLIIEVADTTLETDESIKLPLNAAAGIPETWIVDLVNERIGVYTNPGPDGYSKHKYYGNDERIDVEGIPGLTVSVSQVLGMS